MKQDRTALYNALLGLLGVGIALALWQLLSSSGLVARSLLPGPIEVAKVGLLEVQKGNLFSHIAISLLRVAVGFCLGATAGVLVGIAMGSSWQVQNVLYPIVELLRPVPPLAWIPLAIIWFGIGENSKLFLLALTAFFPVVVNSYKGARNIDPYLIWAAKTFDMKSPSIMLKIALPAAMPDITIGLRFSWSLCFAVLVAAEMIAAQSGMGFMINDAMNLGQFDIVIFGILLIGFFSLTTDYLWQLFINRKLLRWYQGIESVQN